MIDYQRFVLKNGLKVLVHEDTNTPMVAINVLYNVGARDESPDKTGFAHLFEHLMFGGSKHIPNFDDIIQNAGGENNAFTNNDMTNFYNILPAENIETAFWLESDRMLSLNFDERVLEVQRKVVLEEFKETCTEEPYGDVWHHIADMAYQVHPYRWPTIGKVPKHVETANMDDVRDFYHKYYRPNNAILVVSGNTSVANVQMLAKKWFEDIPMGVIPKRTLPTEPPQKKLHQRIQQSNVPVDALYLAFHVPGRTDKDYYAVDLLSDMIGNGRSSRLYKQLLKKWALVSQIDCYITGSIDPGLLIIEARPTDDVTLEQVEKAIWQQLELLKNHRIEDIELQKYQNGMESTLIFSEMNILNKALNLAFFELIGEADLINKEAKLYQQVTIEDIYRVANNILTQENCSAVYYYAE